ncbi:MAG: prevent-host-death protein [Actinomycetota bacterium]|nr:prevent-host-death protein [Actinomycetota bacterium]
MPNVSATEAARRFSDLLDGVEHRGEHYTIFRHGRAVAELGPATRGGAGDAKDLLRRHSPDSGWRKDVEDIRSLLAIEDRV